MTKKIFLISSLFLFFSFYLADNARAAVSCEATGFDCINGSECSASGGKILPDTDYVCGGTAGTVVCCDIKEKTCTENGYTCQKVGTICANAGKGACPDNGVCCGATGMECAQLRGANAEPNCLTQSQCGQIFSQGYLECQPLGKVCCNKKAGTGSDFTEAECESFGGYCYKWTMDEYDECPTGSDDQIGYCVQAENINCCKKDSGNGIVPDELAGLPTNPDLVKGIFENIADWLLSLIGILAVIGLVVAGIQYYFTAADEKMVEKAKKTMMASIIGLVVALSGYIAIETIDAILNASL